MRGPHVRFCERADARLISERHPTRCSCHKGCIDCLEKLIAKHQQWDLPSEKGSVDSTRAEMSQENEPWQGVIVRTANAYLASSNVGYWLVLFREKEASVPFGAKRKKNRLQRGD